MKNKYNRKYQISYKTNISEDGYTGYFETVYLYPNETEFDLINKIEGKIRFSNTNTIYEYTEVHI
jgi:hypothetical protein